MEASSHFSKGPWARLIQKLGEFARNRRGNVAMMFGIALPVLLMMSLGAIDVHQASRVKANLQDALDAAALAAARSNHSDAAAIQAAGMNALKANMPEYFSQNSGDTATFVLEDNVLLADAKVNVQVLVANIILPPYGRLLDDYLPVSAHSEVLRASRNVEVGLALDVTGSMSGERLSDLKAAAKELIDLVVQEEQVPFYSKMGLAPYAVGVNLGGYAQAARGPIPGGLNISGIDWREGSSTSITNITRAKSGVVTAKGHGLATKDIVWISNVRGMREVNSEAYEVVRIDDDSFNLKVQGSKNNLNTENFDKYDSGGRVQKCKLSSCLPVVSSNNHGFKANDLVWIEGVSGISDLNNKRYTVQDVTRDSFSINFNDRTFNASTGSGRAWCVAQGCRFYYFPNASNSYTQFEVSTCASERIGAQAFTSAAPSVAYVGRSYTEASNACPSSPIRPLTSSKTDLKSAVDGLSAVGSTAGQIGVAWAWYLVAPQFAQFWGAANAPGAHDPEKTLKVVVLMTDGEFNSPFCKDVIAADAGSGSGLGASHHNCNAPNKSPFTQAVSLCNAMKSEGVIVYTVGFNLGAGRGGAGVDTAIEVMETCATNINTHFHDTKSGVGLREAFKSIGRDITRLRLAR